MPRRRAKAQRKRAARCPRRSRQLAAMPAEVREVQLVPGTNLVGRLAATGRGEICASGGGLGSSVQNRSGTRGVQLLGMRAGVCQNRARSGRHRLHLADRGPTLFDVGTNLTEIRESLDRDRPRLARNRCNSPDFDRSRFDLDLSWPKLARSGQESNRFWAAVESREFE